MYWKTKAKDYLGLLVGVFFVMVFSARFLVEFIKEDQEAFEATMSINMGQWLSIPFIVTGIVLIVLAIRRGPVYFKNQVSPMKK
jgi:prolipoprotein diacylglyceryltransferase